MKACCSCALEKPVSEFYTSKRSGLFRECKTCVLAQRKRRYELDADTLKARVLRRQRTPQGMFEVQRNGAARRGIAWCLTFEQWWAIWQESGKWAHRGIRRGQYVMARHGDVGPYAVGNVKIITTEENIVEGYEHRASIKNLPATAHPNVSESQIEFRIGSE